MSIRKGMLQLDAVWNEIHAMINYISLTDKPTKQSIIEHLIVFDHRNAINSNNIFQFFSDGLGKY